MDGSCDVSYDFVYADFEVRSKDWPGAKLDANGEGLLKEIKGYGALTPNDAKFGWYVDGRLPIGMKSCVGNS